MVEMLIEVLKKTDNNVLCANVRCKTCMDRTLILKKVLDKTFL